jgi:ABC-type glutathione transport system ATPase component
MSVLFITHDLALVGEIADQVIVMQHGVIREQGEAGQIFYRTEGSVHAARCCIAALVNPPVAPAGHRRFHAGERATSTTERQRGSQR